jgi:hypothetical protein
MIHRHDARLALIDPGRQQRASPEGQTDQANKEVDEWNADNYSGGQCSNRTGNEEVFRIHL